MRTRKPFLTLAAQEELTGWLFAFPWIFGFLLFVFWPMIWSAVMSFTNYDLFSWRFIGPANYQRMFTVDDLVLHSLSVTPR